jgi:hypothetical protein
VAGGAFAVVSFLYDFLDKLTYRRNRAELLALLHEEGFDRDTLLPLILDEESLQKVTRQLKLDPGPFPKWDG